MPDPAAFQRSKLPPEELAVARRLRALRESCGLSLSDLAAECELTKSALRHYEAGAAPLPFDAGNRICHRFNVHQSWLAVGDVNRSPFVNLRDLEEHGAKLKAAQKLSFFEAYSGPLAGAILSWNAVNQERVSAEDDPWWTQVILRSDSQVESLLSAAVSQLRAAENQEDRAEDLKIIEQLTAELRRRENRHKAVDATIQIGELTPVRISKRLKQKRAQLGLTQEGAAKEWGVPVKTLQKWEQGVSKPRGLAMRQLEQILRESRQSSD